MDLAALLDTLFARLAWTSAQALLLIAVVALLIRLFPRLPAALRCLLWWLIGAQLVLGLCWPSPVSLPLLPARSVAASSATAPTRTHAADRFVGQAVFAAQAAPAATTAPRATATLEPDSGLRIPRGPTLLVALWLAGMGFQLVLSARQWRQGRRVLRKSTSLRDATLEALCRQQAAHLGLRRTPALRVSPDIDSPQVTGLWRAVILLPAEQRLSAEEAAMAVTHELAHLRRGDLWLGWIPALAQRLFFFHPLARRAMREYALCREAACDALVLRQDGVHAGAYGQLLLRLGVASPLRPGLAGASPSFRNLKRRLTMLRDHHAPRHRAALWVPVVLLALAGVMPWRVTARQAAPAPHAAVLQVQPSPHAIARKARPAAHAQPASAAESATMRTPPAPPSPPTPPAAAPPPPPAAPPAPPAPPPPPPVDDGFAAHHVDIDTHDHARNGFALLDHDSVIVEGSNADVDRARKLRHAGQPLLFLRRGDKAWVIHDPATLKAARAAYAPVIDLAREQGKLAGKQGELAGRQAAFAGRQAALASRQSELAARTAEMAARDSQRQAELQARRAALDAERQALKSQQEAAQARLNADTHASAEERARMQADLAREQARLTAQQKKLDAEAHARDQAAQRDAKAQHAEVQREHAQMVAESKQAHAQMETNERELAKAQAALGAQQRELSKRQQQASAEAKEAMQRVLDQAIRKGLAHPVSLD